MTTWHYQLAISSAGLALLYLVACTARSGEDACGKYRIWLGILLLSVLLPVLQCVTVVICANCFDNAPATVFRKVEVDVRETHGPVGTTGPEFAGISSWSAKRGDAATAPPKLDAITSLVLGTYVAGFFLTALHYIVCLWRTRRFLARCVPLVDLEAIEAWHEVAVNSPMLDAVLLLSSSEINVPCCGGVLRPCLVLPRKINNRDVDALRWALRHELVHLERRDALVAFLQRLLTTLYWFNPFVWAMSRQLNWWREASCDLRVVRQNGRRRSYALALLSFAEKAVALVAGRPTALLHAAGRPAQLRRRIELLGSTPILTGRSNDGIIRAGAVLVVLTGQLGAAACAGRLASSRGDPASPYGAFQKLVEVREYQYGGRTWVEREEALH